MDPSGQIAPTQAKITELNHAIITARNAANMLLKKAQVFDMYLKDYAKKLEANTELVENIMKKAFIALALARYAFASANLSVFAGEMVEDVARIRVNSFEDRFLGNARFYTMYEDESAPEMWPLAGLARGGQEIAETKKIFRNAAEILVCQITLQSVFTSLCNAKETEMRKSVVIDKVVIPRIQGIISYIRNYLDDMERDDTYRYKLVKKRYARKFDRKEEHAEKQN